MDRASPAPSTASSTTSIPSISTPPPTAAVSDKADDSSKLKTFLSILRKYVIVRPQEKEISSVVDCKAAMDKRPPGLQALRKTKLILVHSRFIGVTDIAAVRFSLPSQLLEPIPNLEYWQYLDRPETFASIGQSDDELGRMLEVLRFWFTKDLKYVKGKPCKPYNSALGEFFRCNWEVAADAPPIYPSSRASKQPPADPLQPPPNAETISAEPVRISFLTEQTSHHPPVSAYYIDCPARGISARGFDQLSAKFTGTAIRVIPGNFNLGIFLTLHKRDNEEYQLTHPDANLGGLFRGSLSVTVADTCFIMCPKTKLKAILHYLDEGWIGKSQNLVQGVIYRCDPENDKIIRIKDVPEKSVLARLEGCWKEKIYYTIPSTTAVSQEPNTEPTEKKQLLIDLLPLMPVPKIVPPEEGQLPNESRIFWRDVTNAILSKQYGEATKAKQAIEERQREKAADRQARREEWRPRFFTEPVGPKGRPELTEDGKQVLQGMQELKFYLKPADVTAS